MDHNTVHIATGIRLGTPPPPYTCATIVGHQLPALPYMVSVIYTVKGYTHDMQPFCRSLILSRVPACLEPQNIFRSDVKWPDDGISVVLWKCGKLLLWDATCCDTT